MRYDDPTLVSVLSGEYVLGTLTARARRRFDRLLAVRRDLRDAVGEWEGRLAFLNLGIRPIVPSQRVWTRIAEQLGFAPAPRRSLWQSAGLWRAVAAVFALLAVALGLERMQLVPKLADLEQQVASTRTSGQQLEQELARKTQEAEKLREDLLAARASLEAPIYVSLMSEPGGKPLWLVKLGERTLRVTAVGAAKEQPGKSYELWMLQEGGSPVSLGLLPKQGTQAVTLSDAQFAALARSSALAVSLEPEGGSPTGLPTGPVLYSAPLLRS
jgi:anti-sigma-K factor RskA